MYFCIALYILIGATFTGFVGYRVHELQAKISAINTLLLTFFWPIFFVCGATEAILSFCDKK